MISWSSPTKQLACEETTAAGSSGNSDGTPAQPPLGRERALIALIPHGAWILGTYSSTHLWAGCVALARVLRQFGHSETINAVDLELGDAVHALDEIGEGHNRLVAERPAPRHRHG